MISNIIENTSISIKGKLSIKPKNYSHWKSFEYQEIPYDFREKICKILGYDDIFGKTFYFQLQNDNSLDEFFTFPSFLQSVL